MPDSFDWSGIARGYWGTDLYVIGKYPTRDGQTIFMYVTHPQPRHANSL
jgi:hypothetical protein